MISLLAKDPLLQFDLFGGLYCKPRTARGCYFNDLL